MWNLVRSHFWQIVRYGVSGGASAVVEIVSYLVLLKAGTWYITASVIAFVLSYITAFLLHKYVVFQKNDDFFKHLGRHMAVEGLNLIATNVMLYIMVEHTLIGAEWGKVIVMGLGVVWNFLLFKFLVFV